MVEEALKLDPKNGHAYDVRGVLYAKDGKIKEALEDFRRAVRYAPEVGRGYMHLGSMLIRLEKYDEALETFRKGAKADPSVRDEARQKIALAKKMMEGDKDP